LKIPPSTHEGTGKMEERLDFAALWPFELGRFGFGPRPTESDEMVGYVPPRGDKACFLEVASFLKSGHFDDAVALDDESGKLGDFIMEVQDAMPDVERQRLKPFIPRFIDSLDVDKIEAARGKYLTIEALTVWLPMALEAGGLCDLAIEFRDTRTAMGACACLLEMAKEPSRDFPFLAEIIDASAAAWIGGDNTAAVARVAIEIMKVNEPAARRVCLGWRKEPEFIGTVPGIYDAVINAIDGALKLGRQGPELDPWAVAEAVERFREVIGSGSRAVRLSNYPPFAIVEPSLA
jgi:hypothetical protein